MKAVRYHAYGSEPTVEEVDAPAIGPDDVLIRVERAALNPLDVKLHSGRMQWYFALQLPYVMGSDLAGVVERVGSAVTNRKPGEQVIGHRTPLVGGAFAQLAAVPACDCVALPPSLSLSQGAAIPTAASTAWLALFETGRLQAGQSVLVHAGAGGVGGFAVQFAKAAGAHVVATASGEGVNVVRSLGADLVIDYQVEDFDQIVSSLDLVLDTVGGETLDRSFAVLKRGGRLVSAVIAPDPAKAAAADVEAHRIYFRLEPGALSTIVEQVVRRDMTVLIDSEFPFHDVSRALARQASARARGKVVLTEVQGSLVGLPQRPAMR